MRRTRSLLATAAVSLVAATLTLGTPADARPAAPAADRAKAVAHATGADTRAEQDAVRAFWTPERMRQAIPRDGLRAAPRAAKPAPTPDPPEYGTEWTAGQNTVGKVFFTLGKSMYVCSGNSVDFSGDGKGRGIQSNNLVTTAGHCVTDGQNRRGVSQWASRFLFVPSYDATASYESGQPLGTFVATRLLTTTEWDAQGADKFNYDFGMAVVGTGNTDTDQDGSLTDETLKQAADATDIAFLSTDPGDLGVNYSLNVHSFGYPAGSPYDGTKLISCWGATGPDTLGSSTDYRLPCNMTGGSSGGPWLLDDGADVGNVQVSVNSFGYTGEEDAMYGPILGPSARAVYDAAAGSGTGNGTA